MPTALIVLAAGQGTRMRSALPKVLHEVAGAPLLSHALAAGAAVSPRRTVVVAGEGVDLVRDVVAAEEPEAEIVVQEERRGTAHAVMQARPALEGFEGDALILYGDTPFIRPETLERMAEARDAGAEIVVLGFEAADPGRYGRLIVEDGRLLRIVEAKDARPDERSVTLCNAGIVMAALPALWDLLDAVRDDNAAGEFYLTDIVGVANARGGRAEVIVCEEAETLGVNSRIDLAAAEATFQDAARLRALEEGVTLTAPATVHFSRDTILAADVVVEPHVVFGPGVRVEPGARIRAFSHLEGCVVEGGAVVGPYARLRPGAHLHPGARVGNFVEVKAAEIGEGAKVPHLAYVGDATVGARANLGAGTVTCNYDGVMKHRTVIGEGAFVGSSTMLVAPVTVGAEALTASGSVITGDVPDGAFAVARGRQRTIPGRARELMQRLRAMRDRG